MATSPTVANIVYNIVPLWNILAEELSNPALVINSSVLFINLEFISLIFTHGIEPLSQNSFLDLNGVPPRLYIANIS